MNETTQQTIVQTLREKILAGELSPGQRLVEAQLAQWLGVSRTPLRYALSVLSSEGLLDRSGGRGYVVRRFSVRDVLNAIDVFRSIESLPFARQSSELFDRPSINLGRIWGGDALNKVPDRCVIDVDIRYLPDQDPAALLEEVRGLDGVEAAPLLTRPPATVNRDSRFVRALREAAAAHHDGEPMSVGRDGASDAVSFLRVGVPAVEFGPVGAGHHGPEEWVSVSSLETYRQALESFLRAISGRLGDD